jgi:diaminohydroxyphosphoribosylaminopyrimidine deaminase/5-amino-6-(5-phosphoribosylamino)uracil reductase
MVLKAAGGRVDLKTLFRKLGSIGFQSVLVEGGGRLHSELVKRGLIDRFVIFIAPKLLGDSAVPWIRDIGVNGIKNALQINITGTFLLGDNIVLEGYPNS